ncbi:MAG: Ig-like domain-containing protein [Lachnospiraceae bacterium]|nr:Ig-like domain-containing protein [Lachnospiraceae bacterium]
MANYVEIEGVTGGAEDLVKQNMKFRTGKFVWRVSFTAPLNPASVNNMNLYVTTMDDKPLKTAIRYDTLENYIEIEPLEAYAQNESYLLTITKNVESRGGQKLKNEIKLKFRI